MRKQLRAFASAFVTALGILVLAAPRNSSADTAYYYFVNAPSANSECAVIEVWCPPGAAPGAEPGWTSVTLQDLHDAGLNSPSENMAWAMLEGTVGPRGEADGCNYRSYARCPRVGDLAESDDTGMVKDSRLVLQERSVLLRLSHAV